MVVVVVVVVVVVGVGVGKKILGQADREEAQIKKNSNNFIVLNCQH